MEIVVAVKQVGQLDEDFELDVDAIDVDSDYLDWALNEWDGFAVEEAIRQRDVHGGTVTVISIGGDEAVDALRAGVAMGADRAVHVACDRESLVDPLVVATLLARSLDRLDADLVLLGVQSADSATAAVGSAVAALADLPIAAVVRRLSVDGATIEVERELEGGVLEQLRLATPALLTIQTGINEPRYATLRAIKQAEQHEIETINPADLGLTDQSLGQAAGAIRREVRVPEATNAELIEGGADEVAARVAAIVRERTAA